LYMADLPLTYGSKTGYVELNPEGSAMS